jgi:sensor histidine kinase YesM
MPPAGFELTIPASERPQTHALDRAATGICIHVSINKTAFKLHAQTESNGKEISREHVLLQRAGG